MNRATRRFVLFPLLRVGNAKFHGGPRMCRAQTIFPEKQAECVDQKSAFYMRLDGHAFGHLVKKKPSFKLPWDANCMLYMDLFETLRN